MYYVFSSVPPKKLEDFQYCLFIYDQPEKSRDSVVGIVTSYGLDDGGVRVQVPVGVRILTSPNRPDRL
jgi:hypothetical protein